MADQTTSTIVVDASPAEVMAVIADFEAYPKWAQGIHEARVVEDGSDGRAREVYFEIEATPIKDSYTLRYDWHGEESVSWTLVSGKMLKRLDGTYALSEQDSATGGGTLVTYRLAAELGIPMIGMLKRKAEKVIVDTALKGLKKRVEQLG